MFCFWLPVAVLVTITQPLTNTMTTLKSNPHDLLLDWLTQTNRITRPLQNVDLETLLRRGEAVYLDGGSDSVIRTFGSLILEPSFSKSSTSPVHDNIRYDLAGALAQKGSYRQARQILIELISRTPASAFRAPALRKLTDLSLESGQYEPFLTFTARLPKDLSPEELDEVVYLRGKALADLGQAEEARKALEKVSRANRFRAAAQYLLGVIAIEDDRSEEALERFCSVVAQRDTSSWSSTDRNRVAFFISEKTPEITDHARLALGRIRHDQGRYHLSVNAYRQIAPTSPLLPLARYESAWSLYRLGRYTLARFVLEKLLIQDAFMPDWPSARLLLGRSLLAGCFFEEATREFALLETLLAPFGKDLDVLTAKPVQIANLPAQIRQSIPSKMEERGTLSLARKTSHTLTKTMQMRAMLTRLVKQDGLHPGIDPAVRLTKHVESDMARAEHQIGVLLELVPKLTRDDAKQKAAWIQLHTQIVQIYANTRKNLAALQKGLVSRSTADLYLPENNELPIRYLHLEAKILGELVRKLVLQQQFITVLVDVVRNRQFKRAKLKVAGWIRAARIGLIDTVLGKKHSKEIEVQNLAYGRYPLSVLKELAESGMLDETMEYWPYDAEDWPDEIQ